MALLTAGTVSYTHLQQPKSIYGHLKHSEQWYANRKIDCKSPETEKKPHKGAGDKIGRIDAVPALPGDDFVADSSIAVICPDK